MSAVPTRPHGPLERAAIATTPLLAVASLAATGVLAWESIVRPAWTAGESWWWPAGMVLGWALTLLAATFRRPGHRFNPFAWVTTSAVLALLLGGFSLGPCLGSESWTSLLVWMMNLFTGQLDSGVIGPDAAVEACRRPYSAGFQTARFLGLLTVFMGAVAALASVFAQQFDQMWARRAHDVDVVVGLDRSSVALVKSLIAEREGAGREPGWYSRTWRQRLGRGFSGVVVVHPNGEDPLLGEVRAAGGHVYLGDATEASVLSPVLRTLRGRTAVRRLFAVGSSQQDNLAVVSLAQQLIGDSLRSAARGDPTAWLSSEWVPRLVARFDDPREAHDWRLTQLTTPGCFTDAITVDELVARGIVDAIADANCSGVGCVDDCGGRRCDEVILIGDTPLTIAILEELTRQRSFRAEVAAKSNPAVNPPVVTLSVSKVTVVAPRADLIVREWSDHAAPCSRDHDAFAVLPAEEDWEFRISALCTPGRLVAVVVTDPPSPHTRSRATRVTRTHSHALVFSPNETVSGVEGPVPGVPNHAIIHYGATLLQGSRPPDDSWTVLARQSHEVYCAPAARDTVAARHPWDGDPTRSLPPLPQFLKDDNLRQHRYLLQQIGSWGPSDRAHVARQVPVAFAEREHERWCRLREAHGWTLPPPDELLLSLGRPQPATEALRTELKQRWEASRQNQNLVRWQDAHPRDPRVSWPAELATNESVAQLHEWNVYQLDSILARLASWGIAPTPESMHIGTPMSSPAPSDPDALTTE